MGGPPDSNEQPAQSPINISGSQGVQAGDYGRQVNIFNEFAAGRATHPPRMTVHGEIDSPYLGLNAFREDDAPFFFGRETAVDTIMDRLARRLNQPGPLIVSGVSGAGKSSLLRAGVLPHLTAAGLPGIPESRHWPHAVLTSTDAPLRELATHMAPLAGTDPGTLLSSLRDRPADFALTARAATRDLPGETGRVLLVIDQFEQVFTQCPDGQRHAFISALHAAATARLGPEKSPPALVVIVVRADFEARCAEYEELEPPVQDRFLLAPMTERQLRLAIVRPAEIAHATVEEPLTDELIRAAQGSSVAGGLPHFSHALDQAWRSRVEDDVLRLSDYERVGGFEGSIAASADRAFGSLSEHQQAVAQQVFMRLVTTSSDLVVSAGRATRDDLTAGASPGDVDAVVEAFAAERLLTVGEHYVEISHEVLLTAWAKLRGWLDGDRIDLANYARLNADAENWDARDRPVSYLYSPGRLDEVNAAASRWEALPGRYPALGPVTQAFLNAARHAALWSRRKRRMVITGLSILSAVAITAAGIAVYYAADANRQTDIATSRSLAAQSINLFGSAPTEADKLAVAAWREWPTSQAASAMTTLLADQQRGDEFPSGAPAIDHSAALSPNGTLLATANSGFSYVQIWNTATGKPTVGVQTSPQPDGGDTEGVAFSPDSKMLATADFRGDLELWNPATGALIREMRARPKDSLSGVEFSPDGKIVAGYSQNYLYLWNTRNGRPVRAPIPAVSPGESLNGIAFAPNSTLLAVASSNGYATLWKSSTGQQTGHPIPVSPGTQSNGVAFSRDGKLLASAGDNGYVTLWNLADNKQASSIPASPGSETDQVAFTPDGRLLASVDGDGYVKWWNPRTGHQVGSPMPTNPSGGAVESIAFSSTGLMASANENGSVQLWNTAARSPVGTTINAGSSGVVRFTSKAGFLTADADGYVARSPDVSSGDTWPITPQQVLNANDDMAVPVSGGVWLSTRSGGKFLAAAPRLAGGHNSVNSVAFSPGGTLLATGDDSTNIRFWNTSTGKYAGSLPLADSLDLGGIDALAFSPDGKTVAAEDMSGYVTLWNLATHSHRPAIPSDTTGLSGLDAVGFSPNGTLLATSGNDGKVLLRSPSTGRLTGTLTPARSAGIQAATALAFSPDGRFLAVGYYNGSIQLWNTSSRTMIGGPIPPGVSSGGSGSAIAGLTFASGGSLLLSADSNGNVTPLETWQFTDPYAALCDDAGAPNQTLWQQYAPGASKPAGICANVTSTSKLGS